MSVWCAAEIIFYWSFPYASLIDIRHNSVVSHKLYVSCVAGQQQIFFIHTSDKHVPINHQHQVPKVNICTESRILTPRAQTLYIICNKHIHITMRLYTWCYMMHIWWLCACLVIIVSINKMPFVFADNYIYIYIYTIAIEGRREWN